MFHGIRPQKYKVLSFQAYFTIFFLFNKNEICSHFSSNATLRSRYFSGAVVQHGKAPYTDLAIIC